jgi:hypothetical protein
VYYSRRIWKRVFFCITNCVILFLFHGLAQTEPNSIPLPNNLWTNADQLQSFFEREGVVGSTYLSKNWIRGTLELSNHRRIPGPDQVLLFNFDKIKSIVYVLNQDKNFSAYPIDSISSFFLVGSEMDYSFEKVSWISNNFFLIPIIKSEKGYSLYKRLLTKLVPADYSNGGYFITGKKFDEFIDEYEYYLVYPGNTGYKKMYLKESNVRRVFKYELVLLNEFFSMHENDINEQSMIGIIQYINEKKYPE